MATTSGLVQRLKWVDGLKTLFVYLGPTPNATRLRLLMFDASDESTLANRRAISGVLMKARNARIPVSVFHDPGQSTIYGVDLRNAAIQVDGVEVTQAIQTLSNTIPMLANKRTVARIYLSSRLAAPLTVRGQLRVSRSGTGDTIVTANADVIVDPAEFLQMDVKRNAAAKTLNFVLPIDKTVAGNVEMRLERLEEAGSGARHVFAPPGTLASPVFAATPPLRITVIGFSYTMGNPPQTFTPTALDFDLLRSWLARAYPVGDVTWLQRTVTANAAPPFDCGDINSQLAAIRALDVGGGADARTHYFGLVSDGGFFMRGCAGVPSSPNPGAVGSGPTGPASWGWDFDGSYGDWYGGHELGHTFGRRHPGFCSETQDDLANYPFDNGQLSNADGVFAGFDTGDPNNGLPLVALPGVQWHDVMTYCNRQWLSSYTYDGIRQRLIAEDALSPGPDMGSGRPDERFRKGETPIVRGPVATRRRLVQVIARVNLTKRSGTIDYVLPLDEGSPATVTAASDVALHVLNSKGQVLDRYTVDVTPEANEGHGNEFRGMISTIIAVHPEATKLELRVQDHVVDSFEAGAAPAPIPDPTFRRSKGRIEMSWREPTRRGSRVTYSVQVSADGGRTWQAVAVGSSQPKATLDDAMLSAKQRVRVRVRASSGFEAAQAEIELPSAMVRSERKTSPDRKSSKKARRTKR
jgi:hypothetical protein